MFRHSRGRRTRSAFLTGFLLLVIGASGCAQVDLKSSLEITELSSGYHDAGLTDQGANKLVPSVSFRLKNVSDAPISSVEMLALFWGVEFEEPKELDEVLLRAIDSGGLEPGASSDVIVVRSRQGFLLEYPRAELFNHSAFRDMTAKLFLKRGGRIIPFGEHTIERRLLLANPLDPAAR